MNAFVSATPASSNSVTPEECQHQDALFQANVSKSNLLVEERHDIEERHPSSSLPAVECSLRGRDFCGDHAPGDHGPHHLRPQR